MCCCYAAVNEDAVGGVEIVHLNAVTGDDSHVPLRYQRVVQPHRHPGQPAHLTRSKRDLKASAPIRPVEDQHMTREPQPAVRPAAADRGDHDHAAGTQARLHEHGLWLQVARDLPRLVVQPQRRLGRVKGQAGLIRCGRAERGSHIPDGRGGVHADIQIDIPVGFTQGEPKFHARALPSSSGRSSRVTRRAEIAYSTRRALLFVA